jgi:hypothetical protein
MAGKGAEISGILPRPAVARDGTRLAFASLGAIFMRKHTSVDAVTTALLGALGLLGACGGSVTVIQGGPPGGEDAGPTPNPTPVGDDGGFKPPVHDAGPVVAPTSCAKHPCTNPTPVVVGGVDTGFDACAGGTMRRRAVVTCPSLLPRAGGGSCSAPDSGAFMNCTKDSDCTESPNGHCELNDPGTALGFPQCLCNYGCKSDSDCGSGDICLCGDPVGKCVLSQCSTGSGCLPGCDCASPQTFGSFACQTPEDTCYSDQDCVGAASSWDAGASIGSCYANGLLECAPSSYAQDWSTSAPPGFTCQPKYTCTTGRPFLVHGAERLAGCIVRPDWQRADLAPDLASCTESQRYRAAAHWARVGAMEHASIAAFARFTLHLLSLGAPADLIALSQQAMGDETEHARLAYALASSYADLPLGPGALAIHGSLDASTTDEIVATLIREGCIGETLAAVEARDALDDASLDPAVRTALEVIARDELRHAELAWKTVAWLLESGRTARGAVRDEVTRALQELSTAAPPSDEDVDLGAFGVLSGARRAELRELTARDVVTRCIDQLVGRARTPQPPAASRAA